MKKGKEENKSFLVERLLKCRTIMCSDTVDDEMVESVAKQLFILEEEDREKPIRVFINSPGGAADSGFAIYDLFRFANPRIVTVCSGICASAAIMIFLGADEGYRFSFPNSRFLLHQPSTTAQGSASDLQITAKEILKIRERYNEIVGRHTGRSIEQVTNDSARDFWLNPEEAVKYGLADRVVSSSKELA